MNRATFFKSLFFGAAAAPAIARVLAEEPSPFVFRKVSEWQPAPRGWRHNPEWENAPYEVHFYAHPDSYKRLIPDYSGIAKKAFGP
jgi:hypothetical protein